MCGRFALYTSASTIERELSITLLADIKPRYNIAPGQKIVFLVSTDEGLRAEHFVWGFVPFFSKISRFSPLLINARAETVAIKPAFKQAFMKRRGLVLMNGYFEWKQSLKGKQPYYIHWSDHRLFAVAALWDCWFAADGSPHYTCCLLTRPATPTLQALHNRMPVILNCEAQASWVGNLPLNHSKSNKLLFSDDCEDLQAEPVTPKMNNWRFDTPEAIRGI